MPEPLNTAGAAELKPPKLTLKKDLPPPAGADPVRSQPPGDQDRGAGDAGAAGAEGPKPEAASGEEAAGDQERIDREQAADRFRERSRDRLLDEEGDEEGAAAGLGATFRAHREARGAYRVAGDHNLFDRNVFHQAHIGDIHLRLDSRQAVGAVSGPVPESELRRVRRIYREPEGYVDLQRALRRQRVLVLAGAPGTGRTCTALALLDELTQHRTAAEDTAPGAPAAGSAPGAAPEPSRRVSRVSPETAVRRLAATAADEARRGHGYLLELPSGRGSVAEPPSELELDALATALAASDSYAVLVVAAGPTATPLLSGRYGLICPPAPTEALLRARIAAHLAAGPTAGAGVPDDPTARAHELVDDAELRSAVGLEDLRPAEAELLADLVAAHVLGRLSRAELLGGCASLAPQQAQEWFAGADREIVDATASGAGSPERSASRSAAAVLHPTASRIALAVLNGAAHSAVAEAARLLTWELAVARDPDSTPARPLFCDDPVSDLASLRAELTEGEVETAGVRAPARIVRYRGSALSGAVLAEVWDRHHPAREPVVRWMRLLADDPRPEIWVRAALASGELCARDFATGYEKLVRPMATAAATRRRAFAATVLDQVARHESHRKVVHELVHDWTRSHSAHLCWTAAMVLGFGHAAPVEAALDDLARIGTREGDAEPPIASHGVVRLLAGPDDRAVLRRLGEWTADQRVPHQDLGLLAVVRLAVTEVGEVWDGEASPDLGGYLEWPLPLALAAARPDRAGPLADLLWTALHTPRSSEAATDCLESWLRTADDGGGPDTRAGLAALLPALVRDNRDRRSLDWLLRRMMNDQDEPLPKARASELWHLATGDRPAGDRPAGDRPAGDRPAGDRPTSDRPAGARPDGAGRGGRDRPADRREGGRTGEGTRESEERG